MDAFPSKRKRRIHERMFEERRNPTKGRTSAESNRILRDCRRFADNLNVLLALTDAKAQPGWMPVKDVVTDKDDDAIVDWRGVAENFKADGYAVDDDGVLVEMQDQGILASNRIQAVTVYTDYSNHDPRDYMIRKTVFSPFDCDQWGSLPLTMHQWRHIALPLIYTRALWQWEEAVNLYADAHDMGNNYEYQYTVGWNLDECKRPFNRDTAYLVRVGDNQEPVTTWTGTIMYRLATTGLLNRTSDKPGAQE